MSIPMSSNSGHRKHRNTEIDAHVASNDAQKFRTLPKENHTVRDLKNASFTSHIQLVACTPKIVVLYHCKAITKSLKAYICVLFGMSEKQGSSQEGSERKEWLLYKN
ncbi:hypothetical protein CEXT_283121 [Caerostris extrusa]|uniref:Uncharacterized protein n=1 Tax=Caerostris extrusa TaxID=172846 RepID=A0AAV4MIG7_CAEEX|nr:hypothetical protein CEXT_283121 [Caerostris extrusa]